MSNTEATSIVSFKDLMQAKMEREQRETKAAPASETNNELSTASTASLVSIASTVSTPKKKLLPIAPDRDYQKVANSVVREVGQGIFTGKSKQMYDYLYSLTRGAINPRRTVRISKPKLMRGTGIGSPQTFYRNINHLESLGLIKRNEIVGQLSGNEYEVFLPEEINLQSVQPVQPVQSVQKPVVPVLPETELTVPTLNPISTDVLATSKTSFKDIENNDDEAFATMLKVLIDGCEKVAGKNPSKSQEGNWKELAELLVMELEIAAARTKSVSNVPAFLTEHLRRRLLGKLASTKSAEVKFKTSKFLKVGKSSRTETAEEYQAEPLSKEGRETVLKTMREYLDKGQNEFIMSFQDSYTQEDWDWLMAEVDKEAKVK
jgi:hypothetical protein